jgi:hypothetical protein
MDRALFSSERILCGNEFKMNRIDYETRLAEVKANFLALEKKRYEEDQEMFADLKQKLKQKKFEGVITGMIFGVIMTVLVMSMCGGV